MVRRRSIASAAARVVLTAGLLSALVGTAAQAGGPTAQAPSVVAVASAELLPTSASVRNGRFVEAVSLDGGLLRVEPPSKTDLPVIQERIAAEDIWATPEMQALRRLVLGYGIVTLGKVDGITRFSDVKAWVGFGRATSLECSPNASSSGVSEPLSNGYEAVIIGSGNGKPSAAYSAATGFCGAAPNPPVGLTPVRMIVSVRWRYLGAGEITASVPSCGVSLGNSRVGPGKNPALEAEAEVAVPGCPKAHVTHVREPIQGLGLASIGARLRHVRLGPVRQAAG